MSFSGFMHTDVLWLHVVLSCDRVSMGLYCTSVSLLYYDGFVQTLTEYTTEKNVSYRECRLRSCMAYTMCICCYSGASSVI